MSEKDGRQLKADGHQTRKYRRQYTKCRKHMACRETQNSIWHKR